MYNIQYYVAKIGVYAIIFVLPGKHGMWRSQCKCCQNSHSGRNFSLGTWIWTKLFTTTSDSVCHVLRECHDLGLIFSQGHIPMVKATVHVGQNLYLFSSKLVYLGGTGHNYCQWPKGVPWPWHIDPRSYLKGQDHSSYIAKICVWVMAFRWFVGLGWYITQQLLSMTQGCVTALVQVISSRSRSQCTCNEN